MYPTRPIPESGIQVLIYDDLGSKVKISIVFHTWEQCAEFIFKNTNYEDSVFVVVDSEGHILWRDYYDGWKEEQFPGHRIEI